MAVATIPCAVIGVIESSAINELLGLRQKLQSLLRQAAFLVRLASSIPIPEFPDIPTNFSISAITPAFLAQIQAACPQLDLSSLAGIGAGISIADPVNQARAAYHNAINKALDAIESHPLAAIAALQNQLDNRIDSVLNTIGKVGGFASCICSVSNAALDEASEFYTQLTTSRPTLITPEIKVQMTGFQNSQNNLKAALQLA